MYPVSAALANDDVMLVMEPGTHGSTYGGNPLACKVAKTALQVLVEEKMIENSEQMGHLLMCELKRIDSPLLNTVRGRGLFCALVLNHDRLDAQDLCLKLKTLGLLSKPTHKNIVRLSPPLIINELQIQQAVDIIQQALDSFK
jgi:ornithine--oxo-acid transaminase